MQALEGIEIPRYAPAPITPHFGERYEFSGGAMELVEANGQEFYYRTDFDTLAFSFRSVVVDSSIDSDVVRRVPISPFSMCFTPPDATCFMRVSKARSKFITMRVEPHLRAAIQLETGHSSLDVQHLANLATPEVRSIATLFRGFMARPESRTRMQAESLVLLALNEAVHALAGRSRPSQARLNAPRLRRVVDYVEANLGEDISIGALAEVACFSLCYFSRSFKAAMGESPHAYVTRRRIDRAKEMLAASDLALAEVALACGFGSQSHFNSAFKTVTGETPGRFRALMRD